jgi:hypothetical protein
MKKYSLFFFILLAYQNCSDVDLVNINSAPLPLVNSYYSFDFSDYISSGQHIHADANLLVSCDTSILKLVQLPTNTLDQKVLSNGCADISISQPWVAMTTTNNIFMYKIEGNILSLKQTIARDSSSTSFSNFGSSVSVKNNILVVGDHYHNISTNGREGAAYIYERNGETWQLQRQVFASDPGNTELFGFKVVTDGIDVFVGSRYDNQRGGVYVYSKQSGSWQQIQKIEPPENILDQQFSYSLDVNENFMAISAVAVLGSPVALSKGSVYLFYKNTNWQYKQKLEVTPGTINDHFGYQVSLDYPVLAVSAPQQTSSSDKGFVNLYFHDSESWELQQSFTDSSITNFGRDLTLSAPYLSVKAWDTNGNNLLFIYQQEAN